MEYRLNKTGNVPPSTWNIDWGKLEMLHHLQIFNRRIKADTKFTLPECFPWSYRVISLVKELTQDWVQPPVIALQWEAFFFIFCPFCSTRYILLLGLHTQIRCVSYGTARYNAWWASHLSKYPKGPWTKPGICSSFIITAVLIFVCAVTRYEAFNLRTLDTKSGALNGSAMKLCQILHKNLVTLQIFHHNCCPPISVCDDKI